MGADVVEDWKVVSVLINLQRKTVLDNLYNCLELSHVELDLVVLANIQAFTAIEAIREKRKRSPPYSFLYRSQPICKEMFLNLYGIGKKHNFFETYSSSRSNGSQFFLNG